MKLFCFISFSILKNLKRKLFSDNRIFGQISTPARKRISSLVHRIEQQPTPHLLWFFSAGQQCERMRIDIFEPKPRFSHHTYTIEDHNHRGFWNLYKFIYIQQFIYFPVFIRFLSLTTAKKKSLMNHWYKSFSSFTNCCNIIKV